MALFLNTLRRGGLRMGPSLSRAPAVVVSQTMMSTTTLVKKGFWAGNFTPREGADMDDFVTNYRLPMIASLELFGGRLVMAAPKPNTVYHHGENAGTVSFIAEFPSVQIAQDWHESPDYQSLIPCRDRHITANYVIAEGTGA